MEERKKHAYFQDQYRRSSNFGNKDTEREPSSDKDGTLRSEKDEPKDTKEIRKTVDKLLKDSGEE